MKNLGFTLITAATILSLASVAYAQSGPTGSDQPRQPLEGGVPPQGPGMGRPPLGAPRGSSTMSMGSSTRMNRPGLGLGSSSPDMRPATNGFVVDIGASSFTLATHRKDNSTTTLTVTITDSTKFMNGSTTGSIGGLTKGMIVIVQGKLATSTNSITADVIHYGNKAMMPPQGERRGVLQSVGNFFKGMLGKGSTTPHMSSSTLEGAAANADDSGFMNRLFQHLFGWM